tara:strand:- start:14 stop:205 length:192 start_codon:yes stop_codon:yes gene_type:complete
MQDKIINIIKFEIVKAINEFSILFSGKNFKAAIIKKRLKTNENRFITTEEIANLIILKNTRRY